jgi:uncharacterized damage-inducible protein DinB
MTVTKEHLTSMFEYVRWGDSVMMRAARSVPDEGYYREQGISAGSIHKLLVHAMAAQWLWLCRWRGESPTRIQNQEDYPTRDSLEQRWPLVHSAVLDFLSMQSPKSLARVIEYRNTKGEVFALPLAEQVLHVIDHAAYHRGQVNTMIKRAGGTPSSVSYHLYCLQKARST